MTLVLFYQLRGWDKEPLSHMLVRRSKNEGVFIFLGKAKKEAAPEQPRPELLANLHMKSRMGLAPTDLLICMR